MDETEDFYDLNDNLRENAKHLISDYSKLKKIIESSNKTAENLNRNLAPLNAKFSSISSMANSVLKSTINMLANNIAEGLESSVGKMFAGARATGGNVAGSMPYIVGERGPEIFVPASSGNIIPHNQFTRKSSNINITMHVNTPDISSFHRSQSQIISQISRALNKRSR